MNARDIDTEVSGLRVPPHSVEAEQSVLGGLLLENAGRLTLTGAPHEHLIDRPARRRT